VGQPTASISPTDLNILYAGTHENRISATASGYSSEEISLVGAGLNIQRNGNGGYLVKVPVSQVGHTVRLSVMARGRNVGSMDFRVKKVPKPLTYLGDISSSDNTVSKSRFMIALQSGMRLGPDPNVPIVFPFTVTAFEIDYDIPGGAKGKTIFCNGPKISPQDIVTLSRLKAGANIYFRKIRGNGPSGPERCNPILLTLQ
jgi:hypothetical protein